MEAIPKWSDIRVSERFRSLSDDEKEQIRAAYFQDFVAPTLEPEQIPSAKGEWDKLTAPPPPTTASDYGKQLVSGALSGAGMIAQGGGELLARGINKIAGTELRAINPLQGAIDYLQQSQSEGSKRAQADTQISGSLFDPKTWDFGADPSVKGLALQGLNAIGQFAPNLAIGITSAGASIPAQLTIGAVTGGLQALGGGAEEERIRFMAMGHDELVASSQLYRTMLDQGVDQGTAKNAVAEAAALGGGLGNAIPSAAEGAFENFLIGAITKGKFKIPAMFGSGAAGKIATGLVGGGAIGGTEETIEQMGQNIGSDIAVGGNRPVTADTLQQFVMGAIAEGAVGSGGAFVQHALSPQTTDAGLISGARPPTPSGKPAPTTPGAIAGEVMVQPDLDATIAKAVEITGAGGSDIAGAIDKEIISDRQNIQGIPGQEREGQEPVQAGIEQGRGAEAVETGRVLQAPGPDRQVNPPIVSVKTPVLEFPAFANREQPEITMAEVERVRDIPTVEMMREAIAAVGEDEFQRQAQAKIDKYEPTTPDQEATLVEATAVEIVVKNRRKPVAEQPESRQNVGVNVAIPGKSPAVSENGPEGRSDNVGGAVLQAVTEARAIQAEFLADKGLTMEQARAMSKPDQAALQNEYSEWLQARQPAPGEALPAAATTLPAQPVAPQEAAKAQPPAIDTELLGRVDRALADMRARGATEDNEHYKRLKAKRDAIAAGEKYATKDVTKDLIAGVGGQIGTLTKATGLRPGVPIIPGVTPDTAQKSGPKRSTATTTVREPWEMTRVQFLESHVRELVASGMSEQDAREFGLSDVTSNGVTTGPINYHEQAVNKAVSEGKPVPAAVLADYPDLRQNVGTSPQVPTVQKSPELSSPVEQKQETVNRSQKKLHLNANRVNDKAGKPYWRFTDSFGEFVTDAPDMPLTDAVTRMGRLFKIAPTSVDWFDDVAGGSGTLDLAASKTGIPKSGPIAPETGERPSGKILGADVQGLSDANIAKFAKSKNKVVSDLAIREEAWRAAQVKPAEAPKPAAPVAEAAKPESAPNYEQAWNDGVADAEKEHKGNRGAAVLWGYATVFNAASKAAGLTERYAPHAVEKFANVKSKSPAPETYQQALATFDEYLGWHADGVSRRTKEDVRRYEPTTGSENAYHQAARDFLKEADGLEGGYKNALAVADKLLPGSENAKGLADAIAAKQDEFRGIAASYDAMADGVIADAKAREDARTRPFNPAVGRLQKKDLGLAKSTASWLRAKLGKTPWFTDGHVAVDKAPVKNIEEFYGTRDKGDNPKDWAPVDPIIKRLTGTRVEATPIAEEHPAKETNGLVSVIFDADGTLVAINRIYYDLLKTMYPQSKFVVRKGYDGNGAIEVMVGDKLVGIVMPLRLAGDRSVDDIRSLLRTREATAAEPTPEPPVSAPAEKPLSAADHLEAAAKLMREQATQPNPEARPANPVAESQAPGSKAVAPGPGDAGVAPRQEGGTPEYSQGSIMSGQELQTNEANRDKTDELQRILRAKGDDFTITPVFLPERVTDGGRQRGDNAGTVPEDHYQLAEKISGLFGKQVVWMTADGPVPINGVVVTGGKLSQNIFIDARTQSPAHVVLGHELMHHMEADSPGVYKALRGAIDGLLRNHDEYRKQTGLDELPDDYVTKEIVGDLMGDNFGSRDFWDIVAQESGGMFKLIATKVRQWLDALIGKIAGIDLGSDQFVTDIRAARKALAQAVVDYAESRKGQASAEWQKAAKGTPDVESYARGEPGPGLPAADIRAHIAGITVKLSVPVTVYDDVAAANADGANLPDDTRGFAARGRLSLVAENIETLLDAEFTLFHELFHVGIRAVAKQAKDANAAFANYTAALNRVAMANPEVRRRAKAWRDKYGEEKAEQFRAAGIEDNLDARVRLTSFDEAVAEMAGARRGKPVTRLNELIAALQRLVRALGFDRLADWAESVTDAEVLSLIRSATQAVSKDTVAFGGGLVESYHRAWHGSPHTFDEFKLQHIGSGEGAQAYGWGMYFAGSKDVAEYYKNTLGDRFSTFSLNGDEYDSFPFATGIGAPKTIYNKNGKEISKKEYESAKAQSNKPGKLYQVELASKEDQYLDWDKPLSEQSEKVKAAIKKAGLWTDNIVMADNKLVPAYSTGAELYRAIASRNDTRGPNEIGIDGRGEEKASRYLNSIGIPGIKYLDSSSRGKGEGNHNFVIFDDSRVKVVESFSRLDQTQTAEFKRWFKDSKVVDAQGKPLVVYHGTAVRATEDGSPSLGDFSVFDRQAAAKYLGAKNIDLGMDKVGNWFTDIPGEDGASMYAGSKGVVYPVFLSIRNPWVTTFDEFLKQGQQLSKWKPKSKSGPYTVSTPEGRWPATPLRAWMKEQGYDGIQFAGKVDTAGQKVWLTLDSTQIKSAIGNRGTFDPGDPDIMHARAGGVGEAVATPFHEENERLRERDKTAWDKAKKYLKRQFSPGGLLPQSVFDEKVTRDSQMNAVEFDIRHQVGMLEMAVMGDYDKKFIELPKPVSGAISSALSGAVSETIKPKTREAIYAMRQYIDRMSERYSQILDAEVDRELAKTGLSAADSRGALNAYLGALEGGTEDIANDAAAKYLELSLADQKEAGSIIRKLSASGAMTKAARAQIIRNNIGEYVHRSYQAFDDRKWFQKLDDATINAAREYLTERYFTSGLDETEAKRKAEVTLHEIVKSGTAYDSMGAFIREGKLGAKDLSILMRRKVIAPEIRALLGEYKDARLNYAKSATKMGRLIWNQTFLDAVRERGMGVFLFEGDNRPPGATKQLSGEASESYAPLNGLWTFPDVDQAFRDALGKEHMDKWYETIVQLNGMVKFGKTILSPTTAARNWQSAFLFTVANGHFDLSHIAKSISGLREYFTQQGAGAKLAYLRELQELGVVYDNPYAGEMMRLLADSKLEDTLLRGKDPMKVRDALAYAQKFYQFGDDFWKIVGFENEKALLIKHAGMTEAQAKKEAAQRVRNTYPTYSMVGRAMHFLRRFPLAGTFVSFPSEIIRTVGNMIRYAAQDWKTPGMRPLAKRRIAGLSIAAASAHAMAAMSMALMGLDDDDEEAVRDLSPTWSKNSNFLFLGRDDKGRLQYVDLSYVDPYSYFKRPLIAILRDQPWEKIAADVFRETLAPFLGTDIAAGAIFEVLANKKESGGQVYLERDEPWRQTAAIADHLRKTLQPGVASNLERTYKAIAGEVSISGKKYDPMEEAAGWAGWRVSTLDAKVALYYRTFEFKDSLRDASSAFNRVARNPNDVSSSEIRSAVEHTRTLRADAFREMARIVKAAKSGGLTTQEIVATLRGNQVSMRDIAALLRGTVSPWQPTPASLRGAVQRANTLLGPGKSGEFVKRYREAREVR